MFPRSLEKIERALSSGLDLADDVLQSLSGLEADALERFRNLWSRLDPDGRATLLSRLGEAAQKDLVLDFMPIYTMALSDAHPAVRWLALGLAAEEAKPDLLDTYLEMAVADPDPEVRLAALGGLGGFTLLAQTEDWPAALQDRLEGALVDALHASHADLATRRAALLSLAYLTTDRCVKEIRAAHLQPDLREAAVLAMGRNCQEMWIADIAAELEADEPYLQMAAAQACEEMEDEQLVAPLIRRIQDPDEEVRLAAMRALGAIGGQDAKAAITEVLQWRNAALRNAARDALEQVRAQERTHWEE